MAGTACTGLSSDSLAWKVGNPYNLSQNGYKIRTPSDSSSIRFSTVHSTASLPQNILDSSHPQVWKHQFLRETGEVHHPSPVRQRTYARMDFWQNNYEVWSTTNPILSSWHMERKVLAHLGWEMITRWKANKNIAFLNAHITPIGVVGSCVFGGNANIWCFPKLCSFALLQPRVLIAVLSPSGYVLDLASCLGNVMRIYGICSYHLTRSDIDFIYA